MCCKVVNFVVILQSEIVGEVFVAFSADKKRNEYDRKHQVADAQGNIGVLYP